MNVSFFVPMGPDFIGRLGFALSHLTNYGDRGVVDIMKFDVVGAIHLYSKQERTTKATLEKVYCKAMTCYFANNDIIPASFCATNHFSLEMAPCCSCKCGEKFHPQSLLA